MKKAIFFVMTLVVSALFVPNVFAAGEEAQIGDTKYATLSNAISTAQAGDEIKLLEDVTVTGSSLVIDKDLTINLNNHKITSSMNAHVISINKGNVKITGTGSIETTTELKSAIVVKGSNNLGASNYTTVTVDENVTLKGWVGIFVTPYVSGSDPVAYGVTINFNGKIDQIAGPNYAGYAIYVNGQIQHTGNAPVINLSNTAEINAEGMGAYFAGYSTVNINGASITGVGNGISAKAGVITIEEGSTIKATGADKTPTIAYGDGISASGAAIQLESNSGYAGKISLNIKGGKIISEKGYAVYEYLDAVNADTAVENIAISGGEFKAADSYDIFLVSDSFDETNKEFVTGGTFSSSVKEYLAEGLTEGTKDNNYLVQKVEAPKDDTVNPDTADINIVSVVIALLLGIGGIAYTVRKRRFN